ncbi:hypothetical protein HZS_5956 [Henneguya salminicola]|nr:hypothetical protein HZS_5956 [Henneguya salminicola]
MIYHQWLFDVLCQSFHNLFVNCFYNLIIPFFVLNFCHLGGVTENVRDRAPALFFALTLA